MIYPGKVSNADCFRIGNIGEVYPADIERLIGAIEKQCTGKLRKAAFWLRERYDSEYQTDSFPQRRGCQHDTGAPSLECIDGRRTHASIIEARFEVFLHQAMSTPCLDTLKQQKASTSKMLPAKVHGLPWQQRPSAGLRSSACD